jgi:CBS domain-containing protein
MLDPIEQVMPCREQGELLSALAGLNKLDAAPELACRMTGFLQDMAGRGLSGFTMTQLISAFNDRLTTRLIELVASNHHLPPVDWCWLALGSEGRHEQTFVTDQDNGLIFSAVDGREAEAMRAVFLPFAQEVNQRLADCGFKLCSGGIMAGNSDWCLSLDEWRSQFIDWVRRPEPAALLNASIFFDLRPLYGQQKLAEALRTLLLSMTRETTSFLHLMAANALQADVPLTYRSEIQVDDSGFLDLKKYGSRIFVDAARIFALATGGASVNSAERLHASFATVGLLEAECAAVDAAFSHILRLRLAQQLADQAAGTEAGYKLKVSELNEVDRVILRESLKQAKRLQLRLKLNYAL